MRLAMEAVSILPAGLLARSVTAREGLQQEGPSDECPKCKGTGTTKDSGLPCIKCGGRGVVLKK